MFRIICPACGNPAEVGDTCKCGNVIPERAPSPLSGSYVQTATTTGSTCKFIPEYRARALFRNYSKDVFCVDSHD